MTEKQRNKDQERHYVEVFKDAFSGFPIGELLADENQERPDVIVASAQGRIGIEVTRILHEPMKREESEGQAMVDEARALYEKRGLPNLQVSVFLGAQPAFTRQNRKTFATALAELVAANIPAANDLADLENGWDDADVFPFEIHSVSILRHPVLTRNYWTVPQAGWILENFPQLLQERIAKKETHIRGYDSGCAALWLLVVAEHSGPSSFFEPSEATLAHTYTSSFDRMFFLELFKRSVFELKLAQ